MWRPRPSKAALNVFRQAGWLGTYDGPMETNPPSSKKKAMHFFGGLACAAIASPFGVVAAALVPVILGFAKEMYAHFSSRNADAENLGWVIAGAAAFVLCLKILPFRL